MRLPWLLSAVLVSGDAGADVAQTLRFSVFHACPPARAAFKAFLVQDRALLRVWRTCVLLTSVFIAWIGPRVPLPPKSLQFCNTFCVYFSKIAVNTDSKSKLCAPKCVFELLAAVL